jgi:hypothetical protein
VNWIVGCLTCPPDHFITAAGTDDERLVAFYRMLNPDKLRHLESPAGSASGSSSAAGPDFAA